MMTKLKFLWVLLALLVGGVNGAWADQVTFTIGSKVTSASDATSGIGYEFSSSNISAQNDYIRIKKGGTLTISASSAQITGLTISYVSGKGTKSTNNLKISSGGGTLTLATDGVTATTWSGVSGSITITDDANDGRDIDITGLTVTYEATTNIFNTFSIEDLRIRHNIYNPTRTVGGVTITATGWLTYNNSGYHLLHNSSEVNGTSSFSVALDQTNIDAGVLIKQVVLVGSDGNGTFNGVTVTGANNHPTTAEDQMVWLNDDGATSATIDLKITTVGKRPKINQIWVFTNKALTYTQEDVTLTFSPTCSSATVGTNYEFADITTSPSDFRFDSQMINDGGTGTTFNGFGLSSGKFTGTAGSTNGDVTIQAYFNGNDFFNVASADHHLVVVGETKTSWDFTTTETIDVTNMTDGSDWSLSSGVYENAQITTTSALTANSIPLLLTDGLAFNGFVSVIPDNCIRLRNEGTTLTIPSVTSDKYVKVTFGSTNNDESRGFEVTAGATTANYTTIAGKTVYIESTGGDFTISSIAVNNKAGFNIYSIEIVNEIPHESMFTMTTPATTTDVSTATDIVLTADRDVEVVAGGSTVNLTVNGTTVPFTFSGSRTLTCTNAALVAAGITLANSTSYTVALPADVIQVNGGVKNSAQNFAFTTAAPAIGLTPERNRTWTFDEFETTSITSAVLENNMELVGSSGHDMTIGSSSKTYENVRYTHRLQFKGEGSAANGRYIHFKVAAGSKISVWGVSAKSGEARNIKIATGTFGNVVASKDFTDDMQTLEYSSTSTETDVYIYAASAVNIYGVKVESALPALTRFSPKGNQYSTLNKSGRTTWPDYTIYYTPTEAGITAEQLSLESSDLLVLGTSGVTFDVSTAGTILVKGMPMGEGGTATMTLNFAGNESYAPASTSFTLTVEAPGQFQVQVADQQIQRGQRSVVTPVITDKYGNPLGIRDDGNGNYTTYVLGEDDDTPDYSAYFDFTYSAGSGTGTNYSYITVDGSGNITTRSGDNYAEVGATRVINVTATVKSTYESAFANSSISGSGTMTIVAQAVQIELDFYFDSGCTELYKITANSDYRVEGSTGVFGDDGNFPDGFPNGRMIYIKPKNEGDEIWFSYAKNADAATLTSEHKIDKSKHIFQYRRGIPIYIDETLQDGDYVTVNAVAMYKNDSGEWQLRGGVAKMKFLITSHDRPDHPTYDPVSPDEVTANNYTESSAKFTNPNGGKIMDTSENVVAYGEGASKTTTGRGNLVYGKFSTSSIYTTYQLINEANVQLGINSVPVVSTEVAKRRFTAVQIRTESPGNEYISTQTYTEYWYLYDTRLALTPSGNQYINVNTSSTATETSVKWYNKITPGWQDVNTKTVTFSIANSNGASGATIDAGTGIVTAGSETGWVRVKASYAGGEWHGGPDADNEPQYRSYTAPSDAYFYVYIADPTKEEPEITPPSRNFTATQAFRVKAPLNWVVRYTTDGSEPSATNGTYLKKNSTIDGTVSVTTTVKAIAYNPDNTSQVSRVVSETYTKVDPLPDPIFDPDGVPSPYYYYTNTLTVQIACAYAGSVIYYTVDGSTPEIGAEGTYKYSGLEKVTISGNVAIKAIAHDPVRDIFSNVVTSNYIYTTEMIMPYFQISDDGGSTWSGEYKNGESVNVTPTTQIRIVDPNTVKGVIFYTLDGSVPADNGTSLIYEIDYNTTPYGEYPFTVAKTTTGNAITILDEASSPVATAIFVIDSSTYPVWEAVDETMSSVAGVHGMRSADGFVISTDKTLKVANTGSKVNLKSLAEGNESHTTYARAGITATFSGFDLQDWTQMSIADDAIGTPLDGVGDYSIKSVDNAQDEMASNFNHAYMTRRDGKTYASVADAPAIHEKTFKVPAKGTYVRFEPEHDGDLTIWVLQQGAVHYENDEYLIDRYIRMKPVYMLDEQGNSCQVKTVNDVPQMWSTARLSSNWSRLQATAAENEGSGGWANYDGSGKGDIFYLRFSDGSLSSSIPSGCTENDEGKLYKKMENKGPNRTESQAIYNLFSTYLTTNNIHIGDHIKPFAIHTGTTISLNNGKFVDDSNDGTGYVLASGGYAKYTFEVKAGKSYYFFAQGSKIGIRGFQFVPTESDNRATVTVDTASTTALDVSDAPVKVTLNRKFEKDTWTSLVLPFSVSTTQLEKVFGDAGKAPEVIHFDKVTQSGVHWRLILMKHYHQMIVAGTPVLIKPAKAVENPTFEGVHIETSEVTSMTQGDYEMMGSFVKTTADAGIKTGDYFMSTSGSVMRWTGGNHYMRGTYAWLHPTKAEAAGRVLSFTYEDVVDGTTGIVEVEQGTAAAENIADGTVYDLRGIKVSDNSLKGLPKGVYIVNSKKIIVK